jgi:hypothetical protein
VTGSFALDEALSAAQSCTGNVGVAIQTFERIIGAIVSKSLPETSAEIVAQGSFSEIQLCQRVVGSFG